MCRAEVRRPADCTARVHSICIDSVILFDRSKPLTERTRASKKFDRTQICSACPSDTVEANRKWGKWKKENGFLSVLDMVLVDQLFSPLRFFIFLFFKFVHLKSGKLIIRLNIVQHCSKCLIDVHHQIMSASVWTIQSHTKLDEKV